MNRGLELRGILLAALIAALPAGTARAKQPCPDDVPRVADLGFRNISCDCALMSRDGRRTWRFLDEPRIGAIVDGGPADGRLREGDVLAAVDGVLITTRAGATRFGQVAPGRPVVLTVRRDGRERAVRIVPGEACPGALTVSVAGGRAYGLLAPVTPPAPPLPAAVPYPVAVDASEPEPGEPEDVESVPDVPDQEDQPRTVVPPRPPRAPRAPRPAAEMATPARAKGWLGIGLSCNECGISADAPAGERVWEFHDQPEISYVDPESPAARSGLRRGDVLTHIDGISLLTERGGRRFGAVRPGQTIRLGYRRGDERSSLRVVAMARPDADMELARVMGSMREQVQVMERQKSQDDMRKSMAEMRRLTRVDPEIWRSAKKRLRYSGVVGSSDVEVRGLGTVAVSKDEETGELVITTSDATIRVRPAEKDKRKR